MSFQGLAVCRGDVNTLQVHMDISMFSIVFSFFLVLYPPLPIIVCLLYLYCYHYPNKRLAPVVLRCIELLFFRLAGFRA